MFRGHPIQLIQEAPSGYELNINSLKELLDNDRIRNKPVVVISIAGDMRRGKSFMLNFFLRYLQSEDKENWLGDLDTPLTGFSWKNGRISDTSGILIWSEPHLIKLSNGEEYAILLMDTQGTFDKKASMKTNAMIFALSAMISSMQIFNINSQLKEDHLDFLSLYLSYGILAMKESDNSEKPFQHLQYLIRDWNSPYLEPYGMQGGSTYLDDFLNCDETDIPQAIELRTYIKQCFSRLDCCLMPFPGSKVISNEMFDGKIKEIKNIFIENLKLYVPRLFSEDYISPKCINGSIITCSELLDYILAYFKLFSCKEITDPQCIYNASVEASYNASINTCKRFYNEEMEKICSRESKHMKGDKLLNEHQRVCALTIEKFKNRKNLCQKQYESEYQLKLENEIAESYKIYEERNEKKNKIEKEPWTLFLMIVWYAIGYVLQFVFAIIGLDTASSWIGWILMCIVLLGILWGVACYTGNEIKDSIDEVTNVSWEMILRPSYHYLKNKTLQSLAQHSLRVLQNP